MYQPHEVVVKTGGDTLNYSYSPSVNSKESNVIAYEYKFGNVMNRQTGVNLKYIDTQNLVEIRYAYLSEPWDGESDLVGESSFTLQKLTNQGDSVYVYVLVSPNDEWDEVNFTTSMVWYYGIPDEVVIRNNVNNSTTIVELIEGQKIDNNTLTVPTAPDGYYFDAWYSDKEHTQLILDEEVRVGQQLYVRYANLPSDYLVWDSNTSSYYVKQNTGVEGYYGVEPYVGSLAESSITDLVIPAMYNDGEHGEGKVTIIQEVGRYDISPAEPCFGECQTISLPCTLEIIENSAFEDCTASNIDLRSCINLTTIGSSAFRSCTNLISVNLSRCTDLSTIGSYAFKYCSNLKYMDLSACTNLIVLEDQVFSQCGKLNNVVVPNGITSIGDSVFSGCSNLTSNQYDNAYYVGNDTNPYMILVKAINTSITSCNINTNTKFISSAFSGCKNLTSIIIPNGVISIGSSSFSNCTSLQNIIVPNSVEIVGMYAFNGCSSLSYNQYDNAYYLGNENNKYMVLIKPINTTITSCSIASEAKIIYYLAFHNCISLTNVTIPSTITNIGQRSFQNCTKLTNITLPNNVTSIGADTFQNCTSLASVTIPESVTSIGAYAFQNCTSLTSVTISESVTSIGAYAFQNCTSLTNISLPSSITKIEGGTFGSCSSLINITIPEGVVSIGISAFSYCFNLTSIVIPSSLKSVSNYAFEGCYALVEVYNLSNLIIENKDEMTYEDYLKVTHASLDTPSRIQTINNVQYYVYGSEFIALAPSIERNKVTTVTLDSRTTEITKRAFSDCTNLTSITIPSNVTSIGDYAFLNCFALAEVYNLSNLDIVAGSANNGNVGYYAKVIHTDTDTTSRIQTIDNIQYYVNGSEFIALAPSIVRNEVTVVTLDSRTTEINLRLFYNCVNLTSITIPDSVTSIGSGAFSNCSGLNSITIPDSVTSIGSSAFSSCSKLTYNKYDNAYYLGNDNNKYVALIKPLNTYITSCSINTNTKIIYYGAFDNCNNLSSVDMSNCASLLTIGDEAFYNCNNLSSVDMSNCASLLTIGDWAFYRCYALTSIIIPANVTSIGNYAFYECYALAEVYNLSNLSITVGNFDIRYVAYYAKVVHTNLDTPSRIQTIDNVKYYVSGDDFIALIATSNNITSATLDSKTTEINRYAFRGCSNLASITIPSSVTYIGEYAFHNTGLTSMTFSNTTGWYRNSMYGNMQGGTSMDVTNASTNATYFKSTYYNQMWYIK